MVAEEIADVQLLRSVASSGFDQVVIEVNSCDILAYNEATNEWNFMDDILPPSNLVRESAEDLFACSAALVLRDVAEEADFNVVNLNFWYDAT